MSKFKRLAKIVKPKHVNHQIFILTILLITIPLLIISMITYTFSIQSVKNEYKNSSDLILNNLSFNIDQYLQSIETGTLSAQMNSQLQDALISWSSASDGQISEQIQSLQYEKAIEHFISTIETTIKNVDSVQIYVNDRVFYSSHFNKSGYIIDNISKEDWYMRTQERKGGIVLFGTHKPFHREDTSGQVISISRVINKSGTRSPLAVLLIDIRLDSFREILDLSENHDRNFVILDNVGNVIYKSDQAKMNTITTLDSDSQSLLRILEKDSGSFYAPISGENSFINFVTSPYSDWTVAQYIEEAKMTEHAAILGKIIVGLAIFSVAAAILFMFILYKRVTQPVVFLSKQVDSIGKGNFNVNLDSRRQDEFGLLYQGINKMVVDIQDYIEKASILKSKQKLSEYHALKSQINPHFLANALETIQMKSIINGQRDIAEMISILGQLFRLHIQTGKRTITLKEELNHIHLYIQVQQMRFGDKIKYIESFDPGSEAIDVLHFSLQPIIENAIVHGLEPMGGPGRLEVSTALSQSEMRIMVHDDGVGMNKEQLKALKERLLLPSNTLDEEHIGIKNVHDQIQLYYGEQYGIEVNSVLEKGTTVSIRIPVVITPNNACSKGG